MKSAKITNIKVALKKGDMLRPFDNNDHGAVGRAYEKIMEDRGLSINRGKGPDYHNVEIKTQKRQTKSASSICRAKTTDILNTPYDRSIFKDNCQQHELVEYDQDTGIITDAGLYDISDDETQQRLKDAYEQIREKMQNVKLEKRIDGGDVIAERRGEYDDDWQLRIPKKTMTKIKDHVRSKAIKDSIFKF